LYGPIDDVEIVIGEGSWEHREMQQGAIRKWKDASAPLHPSISALGRGETLV
jgi:hypothetical protein